MNKMSSELRKEITSIILWMVGLIIVQTGLIFLILNWWGYLRSSYVSFHEEQQAPEKQTYSNL